MPANPARPDLTGRLRQQREQVRELRLRSRGHTETKTFIVGGTPIVAGMYIPPLYVGIDSDGETPEWKRLYGFRAHLFAGTATIHWYLNNDLVATQDITTDPTNLVEITAPLDLADGDRVRPYPADASSDAEGLAGAVIFTTAAA